MNLIFKGIKKFLIVFVIVICVMLLYIKTSYANPEIVLEVLDNAPRMNIEVDENNFSDVKIYFTDYSGIKKENINLYSIDKNGTKEKITSNKILLKESSIEKSKTDSNIDVKYEYVLSNDYFNKEKNKKTNFYVEVTDNANNYIHSSFAIKSTGNGYKVDYAPRIKNIKIDGLKLKFQTRDLMGTKIVRIYDLNHNSTEIINKENLEGIDSNIDIDLSLLEKDANNQYNIRIFTIDTQEGNPKQASRTISLKVKDLEAERKAAEEAARLEAEKKAREEAEKQETERKAREEAAKQEAERKAAEEAAKQEAERKAREEAARQEAEKKKAEEESQKKIIEQRKSKINAEQVAYGMNGSIRVGWKKVKNATSYVLKVRDYTGKISVVDVPENKGGTYAHEYEVYRTSIGDMIYWNIKKRNHNYELINSWMNKNKSIYKIKIIYYGGKNGKEIIGKSGWLLAMPFNVKKDAPEQDTNMPSPSVIADPQKMNEGYLNEKTATTPKIDTKRFEITKINEEDGKVTVEWSNTMGYFTPSFYVLKYKKYSPDNESKNSKREFTNVILESNINSYTINNLKNENEYLVAIEAYGTTNDNELIMRTEEVVSPHTKSTRKAKLANVKRGDPYSGNYTLTGHLSRGEAEAFANYGKNGKAFTSKTKYFIWVNMYELRIYIFTKTKTSKWRLWKDTAVSIGKTWTYTGEQPINGRQWHDGGPNNYTLRYCVNYEAGWLGNHLHSEGVPGVPRAIEAGSRFRTAGCIVLDRLWLKWIYDYGMGTNLFIDNGSKY